MDDGEDDERHDVLHGEDDEGEAVLVQLRGEGLRADLRQDEVGARVDHPVHRLVEQQGRSHCKANHFTGLSIYQWSVKADDLSDLSLISVLDSRLPS